MTPGKACFVIPSASCPVAPFGFAEMRQLLYALRGNQTETNRFLGAWAGTVPIPEFFAPENIQRIVASQPI